MRVIYNLEDGHWYRDGCAPYQKVNPTRVTADTFLEAFEKLYGPKFFIPPVTRSARHSSGAE